jgi:predicted ATPase
MAIEKIRVSNFKSFKDLEIELGPFNVLIGANASGKSNFVQIFRFLRDITREGLYNAASLAEGKDYLRNISIGSSREISFELVSTPEGSFRFPIREGSENHILSAWVHKATYQFGIDFGENVEEITITRDNATLNCDFADIVGEKGKEKKRGGGTFTRSVINREIKDTVIIAGKTVIKDEVPTPFPFALQRLAPGTLLLEEKALLPPITALLFPEKEKANNFDAPLKSLRDLPIAIYDFDPKPAKTGMRSGRQELEEDASNLPIVLRKILENPEEKRAFINLMSDLLPFAKDLTVDRLFDQSLSFRLQETFSQAYLPASLLSDGTVNIVALIVALFFEEKPFVIIEEPERNIHPYLISRVVNMLKEASEKKQIIITTHSPEIVKYVGVEDLLLISRDKEGFSTITRPKDKKRVRAFLEHDLGVEQLYAQDLLGV